MYRPLPLALPQVVAPPDLDTFGGDLERLTRFHRQTRLFIYPELHLTSLNGVSAKDVPAAIEDLAEPADGPRDRMLRQLAGDLGIWLVPGSFYERNADGRVHNSTALYSPDGGRSAMYRKVFPWRPFEDAAPGSEFVVADMAGYGRIGLTICYDAWFPEINRHLAWLGADLIVNVVRTYTSDRAAECTLVRANAIVNQVFVASVNAAGPDAQGRSLLVDPQGRVLSEAVGAESVVLTDVIDLGEVETTRTYGTAGVTRPWRQFAPDDEPIELPLYGGRIDPAVWGTAEKAERGDRCH